MLIETQRRAIRTTLKIALDNILENKQVNIEQLLLMCIEPINLSILEMSNILREKPELVSHLTNANDDLSKYLRKHWIDLWSYISTYTDIPSETISKFKNCINNYNPFYIAEIEKFAQNLLHVEQNKEYFVRLREAYLEMTPVQPFYYHLRIGEVPFNLDKRGPMPIRGEVQAEVVKYIKERLNVYKKEQELEKQVVSLKISDIKQLPEKIKKIKRKIQEGGDDEEGKYRDNQRLQKLESLQYLVKELNILHLAVSKDGRAAKLQELEHHLSAGLTRLKISSVTTLLEKTEKIKKRIQEESDEEANDRDNQRLQELESLQFLFDEMQSLNLDNDSEITLYKEFQSEAPVCQEEFRSEQIGVTETYTRDNFFVINREANEQEAAKQLYDNVLHYISIGDYYNVNISLLKIDEKYLNKNYEDKIKNDLQRSLYKLVIDTKNKIICLNGRKEGIDNRQQIMEISMNIGKIDNIMSYSAIIAKLEGTITKDRLLNFNNEIDEILSSIFLKKLESIETFIDSNNFYEAEVSMEDFDTLQLEFSTYYKSEEVISKSEELKTKLDRIMDFILKENNFYDVTKYPMNPPKDLLAKLELVNSNKYKKIYEFILNKVRQQFNLNIGEALVTSISLEQRLEKIKILNYALDFLPEKLRYQFKIQLDELSKSIDVLQNYDLKCIRVFGDGNCLFRAIALQTNKREEQHKEIRNIAINYMREHSMEFAAFIPDFNETDFKERLAIMSKDGVWGDMYEIYALAQHFKRPIVIIHNNISRNHIIFNQSSLGSPMFLYYTTGLHYDVLTPINEMNRMLIYDKILYNQKNFNKQDIQSYDNKLKMNIYGQVSVDEEEDDIALQQAILVSYLTAKETSDIEQQRITSVTIDHGIPPNMLNTLPRVEKKDTKHDICVYSTSAEHPTYSSIELDRGMTPSDVYNDEYECQSYGQDPALTSDRRQEDEWSQDEDKESTRQLLELLAVPPPMALIELPTTHATFLPTYSTTTTRITKRIAGSPSSTMEIEAVCTVARAGSLHKPSACKPA